jgi:hypothetical protein
MSADALGWVIGSVGMGVTLKLVQTGKRCANGCSMGLGDLRHCAADRALHHEPTH